MEKTNETVPSFKHQDTLTIAQEMVRILDSKKGKNIKLLHVEKHTTIAEYYILCTGNSKTQVRSLTDELVYEMGRREVERDRIEGGENGVWNLVDYGPIIVHIFSREGREFYHLEKLFDAGSEVDISSLLIED